MYERQNKIPMMVLPKSEMNIEALSIGFWLVFIGRD